MNRKAILAISVVGALFIFGVISLLIPRGSGDLSGESSSSLGQIETQDEQPENIEQEAPSIDSDSEGGAPEESSEDAHFQSPSSLEDRLRLGSSIVLEDTPKDINEYAVNLAEAWFVYDSKMSSRDRLDRLGQYINNARDWVGVDPIAYQLSDTRDSSRWHVTSKLTGEITVDEGMTFSSENMHYVTINVPIFVERINNNTGQKMSGGETFIVDMEFDSRGNLAEMKGYYR